MSIYATLNEFGIKRFGDEKIIEICAQGVPPHITETSGTYSFLPPPVDPEGEFYRAVYFIEESEEKGTERSHQEYAGHLLMLTGEEYATMTFVELMHRLNEALDRKYGRRPFGISYQPDGGKRNLFGSGSD